MTSQDLKRWRGDTKPIRVTVQDAARVPLDITGSSFRLAVNPSRAPADNTNQLFEVAGTITDALNGEVEFAISGGNEDQTPGQYWYEVEWTDAGSIVCTILVGRITWVQDIVK